MSSGEYSVVTEDDTGLIVDTCTARSVPDARRVFAVRWPESWGADGELTDPDGGTHSYYDGNTTPPGDRSKA